MLKMASGTAMEVSFRMGEFPQAIYHSLTADAGMEVIPQAGEYLSNGRVPSSYIHILQTPLKGWQHSLPCELFCPSLTADAASNCFWIRSMIGCGLASIFLPRRWETSERKQVSARFVEQCVEKKKLLPWRKFEMASRSSKKSRSRAHKK